MSVVELSDPEWGPYWMQVYTYYIIPVRIHNSHLPQCIQYKTLKKKINDIVEERKGLQQEPSSRCGTSKKECCPTGVTPSATIAKSPAEVEFFRFLMHEVRKTSDFFASSEHLYKIRRARLMEGLHMLQEKDKRHDKNTWTRLLMACVRFYKDALLLENYAIMHFCGYSKILKKHDKMTGHCTRDSFMRNVMRNQNFVEYPYVLELLKESEKLFEEIQGMESVMPLQDEERLFIEAIRDLNYQASRLQAEEKNLTDEAAANLTGNGEGVDTASEAIALSMAEAALKAKIAHSNMPASPTNLTWMQDNLTKLKSNMENDVHQDAGVSTDDEESALHQIKKMRKLSEDN